MISRHDRIISGLYLVTDALLALACFWLAHWVRSHLITPRPLYPVFYYLWMVPVIAEIGRAHV